MNPNARAIGSPYLDELLARLLWIIPLALLLWVGGLMGFARFLEESAPPAQELKPVEARIIELPPLMGGLQGGSQAPAARPKAHREIVKPAPVIHHYCPRAHREVHRSKPRPIAPLAPASPEATAKGGAPPEPSARAGAATGGAENTGVPGGKGLYSGAGPGSDSSGARAIYAPVPKIPDDLRENALQAVAVAHFKVIYDGRVQVSLVRLTPIPRLNQIPLETLKQWRFFPPMKDGVAIDSQFDVRIPIVAR